MDSSKFKAKVNPASTLSRMSCWNNDMELFVEKQLNRIVTLTPTEVMDDCVAHYMADGLHYYGWLEEMFVPLNKEIVNYATALKFLTKYPEMVLTASNCDEFKGAEDAKLLRQKGYADPMYKSLLFSVNLNTNWIPEIGEWVAIENSKWRGDKNAEGYAVFKVLDIDVEYDRVFLDDGQGSYTDLDNIFSMTELQEKVR